MQLIDAGLDTWTHRAGFVAHLCCLIPSLILTSRPRNSIHSPVIISLRLGQALQLNFGLSAEILLVVLNIKNFEYSN